jgi:hypothetical protein
MARDLKRTYGGVSGSGNNMGGSCAAASVLPSMHYLARNGEMGGLAAKGSPSDHDITAATHGLLQQLPFPSSSNNVKVERSSSPAAAVYESTGLYHPSFHTGRAGAQAQQAATEAAAHEAQSGCGLTENSVLINNGSNSSQNGGIVGQHLLLLPLLLPPPLLWLSLEHSRLLEAVGMAILTSLTVSC